MSLAIRNGHVLAPGHSLTERSDVMVGADGRISRIHPSTADQGHLQAGTEEIDASGMVVMPGFVDTHRHTWQSGMRSFAFGWTLEQYMRDFQMRLAPGYTPEDVYVGNLAGALAALDSGITTLRDESHVQNSWEHTRSAIQALQDAGIRARFDYGWPSSEEYMLGSGLHHPADMERARAELLPSDDGLVTMNAHLRGPGMSSGEIYRSDLARARALGLRSSIHAGWAEGDVQWMHDEGLLGDDITLVHCGASSLHEFELMVDTGTHASVTAGSEAFMPGLGAPATPRMMKAGLRPSLGVDVEVSVSGDMFSVMRTSLVSHQLESTRDPHHAETYPRPTAQDLVEFATLAGAKACGLDPIIGTLEVGKAADIILVRTNDINIVSPGKFLESLVSCGHPGNVDTVIVDGVVRKRAGQLLGVDRPRLERLLEASWERLGAVGS